MVAEPAVPTTAMREMNERAEALATKLANKAVDGAAPAPMGHGCSRPGYVAPVAPVVTSSKEPSKIVTKELPRQVPPGRQGPEEVGRRTDSERVGNGNSAARRDNR